MKKLDSSIVAALIIAAGMIGAVLIYVYNTPYERCLRINKDPAASQLEMQKYCHTATNH